jgi:Tol biopolymer transport system component
VLFEMLAGRRPIAAEDTVSDTIAAVLKSEPAWTLLPPDTPPKVRALLERCLRKDLRRRLPHIAEARIEIEEVLDNPVETTPTVPASFRRSYFWPAVAALSLLLGAAATSWSLLTPGPAAPGVTRFDVTPPEGAILLASLGQTGVGRSMEIGDPISPDGHTLAFLANVKGKLMIWLRPLESPAAQPLPRTEDASRPIWSPDSRYIAFFAQGQVKKIAVAGGPPITICTDAGRDLAWSAEDMMLIGGYNRPLYLVSASGGEPIPVTELGPGETTHDYPQFLPDNRHYLFLSRRGGNPEDWDVFVGSLDSKERRRLDGIHAAVRYSPTGHLLFIQDEKLMAQRFDAERLALVGEATPVVDWISAGPRTLFSIAANGTLAYLTPTPDLESQLAWVDRSGAHVTPFSPRGVYNRIDLSPDGRQVAFDRQLDLLLFDIERNLASTFLARPGADVAPVFSPDGGRLAFTSNRTSNVSANNPAGGDLYERTLGAVDGDRPLSTKAMGSGLLPTDWSRDGYLAYTARNDVWALPPPQSGRTEPLQVTKTLFNESGGAFSPDGRWIAYQSNDSLAGLDIYVQAFPDGGRRYPVSAGGGTVPRWSRDGKEIYYIGPEMTLMAAAITSAGTELAVGTPVRLFQSPAFAGNRAYDVGRDGRFLINLPSDDRNDTTLAVIVNWAARLKQ